MERLLLVDDDKVILNTLEMELKKSEQIFKTDICYSVDEAIKLIKGNDYSLVITDLKMPKKDGIELLNYFDKTGFKGYSMIMSAFSMEDSLKEAKSLGIIDAIKKPFNMDWFANKIVGFFKTKSDSERIFGKIDTALRDICRKICDTPLSKFESVDILSFFQVVNMDKRSSTFNLSNNGKSGVVHFLNGNIFYVKYENFIGEEALLKMVRMEVFDVLVGELSEKIDRNINRPFMELMRDIVKKRGENLNKKIKKEKIVIVKEKKEIRQERVPRHNRSGLFLNKERSDKLIGILREDLGDCLLSTEIWKISSKEFISGYNSSSNSFVLFIDISSSLNKILDKSHYPLLGDSYSLQLTKGKMVIIVNLGKYQLGMLLEKASTNLGLINNVIIPKLIDSFEEVMT